MLKSLKVAIPLEAVRGFVPERVPDPGLVPIAMVTEVELSAVRTLFHWSLTWTVIDGEMETPATVFDGPTKKCRLSAEPALTDRPRPWPELELIVPSVTLTVLELSAQ